MAPVPRGKTAGSEATAILDRPADWRELDVSCGMLVHHIHAVLVELVPATTDALPLVRVCGCERPRHRRPLRPPTPTSIRPNPSWRKIRLESGSGPRFDVRLQVAARLLSVAAPTADFTRGPNPFGPFETAADRTLAQTVEAALAQAQSLGTDPGTDPFGFGQQVRVQDPNL